MQKYPHRHMETERLKKPDQRNCEDQSKKAQLNHLDGNGQSPNSSYQMVKKRTEIQQMLGQYD